jgi:16S rRNA C967 or C1407 C5-methylase (RsmB/RsmF family)/NOL1/NOP2/fmu family ribosome biogenesis protein
VKELPQPLLQSLEGVAGFHREAFEAVHAAGAAITSIRANPVKWREDVLPFLLAGSVPWTAFGYYLDKRPSFTFDPFFHAGCYYVQEASSMFLEQAVRQTSVDRRPVKALDLCAAPGGKSTHLQSLLPAGSLLVSNEVIKARAGVLKQNMIKWGSANVVVTNNDPQHFARLEGFFDLMVVDAPCSGSGLFRRDEEAMNEWSPDAVQLCSGRQQRILSDALPALAEGGVLVYSTCSYSPLEDESIADWLVSEWGLEPLRLTIEESWGIVETMSAEHAAPGYRFYPDQVKGEGFYLACFRKIAAANSPRLKTARADKLSLKEAGALSPWVNGAGLQFHKHNGRLLAIPEALEESLAVLQANLYIQYAGTDIGELMRDKLIPDHALALSPLLAEGVIRTELTADEAVRYLQRQDIYPDTERGWQVVCFNGFPLGWINALGNRVNNYYPKGLRILKERNDSDI